MMSCMMRYGVRGLLVAVAAATVVGCSTRDNAATTDTSASGAVMAAGDTTHAGMANDSANAANKGWNDAQIMGFATVANTGEIQENTIAQKKATNAAVKAFARQMVTDHKAMLAEGKALASKANITPDTTKNDTRDLAKDSQDAVKELGEKSAGKDWDEDYIEHEIDGHKKVLDTLKDAQNSATNADLKAMLTKAITKVQGHLDKAQNIKDNQLKS